MADSTLIEWARHPVTGRGATWNIVTGCQIVSPGCTNCYAMKLAGTRLRNHPSRQGLTRDSKAGPVWTGETRFNEQWLTQPLNWKTPRGIFVAAHGDLFADGVTDDQLDRIFAVMALCPQHVFFVLTKRPERMRDYLLDLTNDWNAGARDRRFTERLGNPAVDLTNSPCAAGAVEENWPLPNVWLGVSVEDQTRADERIPILLDTPAAIRFISAEPLLGPVDLFQLRYKDEDADILYNALSGEAWVENSDSPSAYDDCLPQLDWVIAGGESGHDARPMHPDWARALRDQCAAAGVPYFFKQWGSWAPAPWKLERLEGESDDAYKARAEAEGATHAIKCTDGYVYEPSHKPWSIERVHVPEYWAGIRRTDKKASGHLLDGVEHFAMPEVRELADKALGRS